MNEVLPLGWAATQLGCVCGLLNGRAYKQAELLRAGKYRVLRVGNFFSNTSWYYSDLELEPAKYCDNGDLLYAWSASFGPKIWDGGKAIYHYHIWRTQPNEGVVARRFLYYWFEWDKENIKAAHGTGSTMIHVTKGDMENRPLRLPPLPEQRRIVAKIDSLSSKSKRAREHLDHIPRLVEKYKQAMLGSVFSARAMENWTKGSVADVVTEGLVGLVRSKSEQALAGTPYIRMGHYDMEGRWNDADLSYVGVTAAELQRYELRAGDVLFNTRNSFDLVGKVANWPGSKPGYVYNNNLLRLRFANDVMPSFAKWLMMSPWFRAYLNTVKSATTSVCAIYQRSLMLGPFAYPELAEQHEVVRRIEHAFAWIDRLAAEATSARKLIDRLDQAVLAKAFRGELVPQDPNDEPASTLLERIRAEREAVPAAKPRRGRARRS